MSPVSYLSVVGRVCCGFAHQVNETPASSFLLSICPAQENREVPTKNVEALI